MNCHLNPTGGGMRNDHGSNVYTLDELTLRNWISKSDENWDGYITDHIQIGGEFRIQSINGNESQGTFPMQAEIYTSVDINSQANFYLEASLGSSDYEYFILFDKLPKKSWIKVGQSYPTYGFMVDDHTAFIKSGNKKQLDSQNRDLDIGFRELFNPMYRKPLMIEASTNLLKNMYLTMSLFQPLSEEGHQENLSSFSGSFSYINNFGNTSLIFGSSVLEEDEISLSGIFGGISYKDITFMLEADWANNLLATNKKSFASYMQFVYKPIQGLHLITKYDYFDHDHDYKTGSIARYSYGIEIYPLNLLEIKLQVRDYTTEENLNLKNEYLLQVHTWF